ncbi:MAG: FecR family protein [Thiotrichales bacterium]|nr:FecR family protein [Thiotrichales bacterium]
MNVPERCLSTALILLVALFAISPWAMAKQPIGTTVFAQGAVTASLESDIRLVGHGTPVYEWDVLTAGKGSFAIVELNDGTRLTLRPNSVFRFDEYVDAEDVERVRFNLFKGGLRTVTGTVAGRAPDAFELRTPVATVGIAGTDFSARLCERDCEEEAEALGEDSGGGPDIVGRVAFVKGEATAVSLFNKERTLSAGVGVFQGDTLETGSDSFVVIAFRDESRITLLENTQFRISRHEYDVESPEGGSALMRLLQGGIRVVAGIISNMRPEAYQIATPVATISTRGTRFDVVCTSVCAQDGHASLSPAIPAARMLAILIEGAFPSAYAQAGPDGLFVIVRFGRVASESAAGIFEFTAGTTAFIASELARPRTDVPLPAAIRAFLRRAPVPEDIEVQPNLLRDSSRPVQEGDLAVAVYDGSVTATSTSDPDVVVDLGEGDAGLLGAGEPTRLAGGTPAFVTDDPYNVNPDVVVGEDGSVVQGNLPSPEGEDAMSCRM